MSNKIALFKHILARLEDPNNKSLKMSLDDVHSNNIFSLVVDGTEPGNLTRIFIASKQLKPFEVQYHTHRYPILLTSITGDITHHTAVSSSQSNYKRSNAVFIEMFTYSSPLTDGRGLEHVGEISVVCNDYKLPPGSSVQLGIHDFHTMSVSKGSMWIVQEQGFQSEQSRVLGIPFQTEGLYNKPDTAFIELHAWMVKRELQAIVNAFESIPHVD